MALSNFWTFLCSFRFLSINELWLPSLKDRLLVNAFCRSGSVDQAITVFPSVVTSCLFQVTSVPLACARGTSLDGSSFWELLLPADLVIRVPTAVKKTASIDGFYWQEPEMPSCPWWKLR